jgi:transcriptional regulator with PAS, ATPase and Fis domain
LFLDELGEMSLRMQATLLRFLETGEVQRVGSAAGKTRSDVRVIAATNQNLQAQIARGAFREDLFYRLNVIWVEVPPLRAVATTSCCSCITFLGRPLELIISRNAG